MLTTATTTTRRSRTITPKPQPAAAPSIAQTITVARGALKAALTDVGRALGGKSLPVLGHVLIQAENGTLTLSATDLTFALTRSIDAEGDGAWRVTAPGKLLADVVGALPDNPITLTFLADQHTIRLVCGNFEMTIKGMDAEEFPYLPQITGEPIALGGPAFARAIEAVAFAAATDGTRPVLQGVHLTIADGYATLSASDGLRLAQCRIILPAATQATDVLVPAAALADLAPLFAATEQLTLTIAASQVAIRADGRQALVRVIDGKFPDVARVIPPSSTSRIVVDVAALARAVRLARLFAGESANIVRLSSAEGTLTLTANAAELGDQKAEIPAQVTGEPMQVALNVQFLAAALATIPTAQMAIELTTPQRPILLRPVGAEQTLLQLIMPVTVR